MTFCPIRWFHFGWPRGHWENLLHRVWYFCPYLRLASLPTHL